MPLLSPMRASVPILRGIPLLHRGKVCDSYALDNGLLLPYRTNGLSIFDFVLNCLVPQKGMILTTMSHFCMTYLETFGVRTHLVAAGAAIDEYLPEHLRGDPELQSHAMVVRKLTMVPNREFIGRIALTGNGFKEYLKTGFVGGHQLPAGLQDGDLLPYILDTPTTKAEEGHDEPLLADQVRKEHPEATHLLLKSFQIMSNYARRKGILIADVKEEMGFDEFGNLTIGDEVVTPDCCRFWDLATWRKSREASVRKAPPPLDKERPRIFGIEHGINDPKKYDPKNPEDVARVHALEVPQDLLDVTTQTYRYIFWRLISMTVEAYLEECLGVVLPREKKRIHIVFGSESDIKEVAGFLAGVAGAENVRVHVISCHRNPEALRTYVNGIARDADVIIAAGGMAFALPGVLDALLYESGQRTPVIGVALGTDIDTARRSISELPGQPVVMDEINGRVYSGVSGLKDALARVIDGELPPWKPREQKPAKFDVDVSSIM